MTRPIITLTTDFGEGSTYVAQMKGVILGLIADVTIVDVTHSVPPQDIAAGALALRDVCEQFPVNTIHIAVVDPGVGSTRDILGMRCAQATYIAPNNGLLTLVARDAPPSEIVRISNSDYWRHPISATFHGRDIMAPVAAQLALGIPLAQMGDPAPSFESLPWPALRTESGRLTGAVVGIDSFGNVLTNIHRADLPQEIPHKELTVSCQAREASGITRTYADAPTGQLIALLGSNDALELAIVGGNAAQRAGFQLGHEVIVSWL